MVLLSYAGSILATNSLDFTGRVRKVFMEASAGRVQTGENPPTSDDDPSENQIAKGRILLPMDSLSCSLRFCQDFPAIDQTTRLWPVCNLLGDDSN